MQLGYLRLDWQSVVIAIGTGVAAALALLLLRRILGWLLGPIFVHETTRLARKGHTFWLRCLFALGMLALLFFTAPSQSDWKFGFGTRDYDDWEIDARGQAVHPAALEHQARVMARFADEFSKSFLLVAAIAVMLVTPLYFATAISEEKEKRCIDFLLATHVTNYEIVIGKLAARYLNLFGVLLAGLPILAVTQIWGGVDIWRLLVGFVAIVFTMLSYASVSILCSTVARRTRTAVILAYLSLLLMNLAFAVIGYWILTSPLVMFLGPSRPPTRFSNADEAGALQKILPWLIPLAIYVVFHLVVSAVSLLLAVVLVRRLALRAASRWRRVYSLASADPKAANRPVHPLTVKNNPPIGINPLIWKERYLGRTFGGFAVGSTMWLLVNLFIASFFPILLIVGIRDWQELTHGLPMRIGLIMMGLVVMIGVGMRMASCITREREQSTMLCLLSLPIKPGEILRAKWLGAIHRSARPILGLSVLIVLTGISAAMTFDAWLLLLIVMAAHTWFVGNLGLFLSVVCKTSNRAFSTLLLLLFLVVAGSWIVGYFAEQQSRSYAMQAFVRYGEYRPVRTDVETILDAEKLPDLVNPIRIWWKLTGYQGKLDDFWREEEVSITIPTASAICYFFAGWCLLYLSWQRFRSESRRL